jgi:LmbE family N-acetylglucosaminyl deacetylase
MNVLVIASHMDDEVLGCGGIIARHVANKDKLYVCFIAHRIYGHRFDKKKSEEEKKHALKAKKVLGYKESIFLDLDDERLDICIQDIIIPLERYVNKIRPNIVYCPFRQDNNQDHRAVFDAARVVFRPSATPFIKAVYMYEVPSSTEQSPPLPECTFLPNHYVNITKYIDKKIEAYRCYETERRDYPHPRSEQALRVLAQKRGIEVGFAYAEALMVLREKRE